LFRSVAGQLIIDDDEPIHNGSGNGIGNGVRKRQRLTGTAKWQRKNGNGMVETGHKTILVSCRPCGLAQQVLLLREYPHV